MSSPIRLNKVLKELNISLDRAIEFLSSKKIEIEPRPTSKIDQNIYDLLLDEFQTDKSDKDKLEEINIKKRKELEEKQAEERQEEESQNQQNTEFKTDNDKSILSKITTDLDNNENLKIDKTDELNDSTKIQTKFQKLSGLKKTGETIDLDSINKKEEKVEESKKRRRKRISKDVSQPKVTSNKINKNKKQILNTKVEPSDDEIQKQIRETLEKLQGKSAKSKGAKYRKDKRDLRKIQSEEEEALLQKESKIIKITEFITVGEIATLMDVTTNDIISACMTLGIMVTMNQRLDAETLSVVADEFGYQLDFIKTDIEENKDEIEEKDDPKSLEERPPIVTVMGHVDHGKTSLLDYIRNSAVTKDESGGITQHIGAYSVLVNSSKKITFLDTPGHEAFTAMRARGAQITDIVIIVIAADDNIMPQTKEAISHAQAGGVPIIFAINKIDKDGANPDKVKESLSSMNLVVEDWGGKIQSQDISALNGKGVDSLLEKILLEAEIMDLKANPNKKSSGSVLDAYLDKGRGYVSTILVQNGSLNIGDYVLAGKTSGKVKAMFDEIGNSITVAKPSTPVSVLGLDGAPQAGDPFKVLEDEKEAKLIASKRTQLVREQNVRTQKQLTLDEIGRRIAIGDFKELNVIIKGDVDGSVEALTDSFENLSTEEIQVNIIFKGVGAITESDVLLASASEAIIIGFNVKPTLSARKLSEKEQIDIRFYSIIYDAINDLKDAMEGMLSLEVTEESTGEAEVRETFKISKIGTIAGCMVTSGKILRNSNVKVVRSDEIIFEGKLLSLKRFKDDVKEVTKGYDCGIQINDFNNLIEGDTIKCYQEVTIKRTL